MSNETLNLIITAIIVPTLAALVPLLIAFLEQKRNEIKQSIRNENLNKYIDIAEDAISTAVVSVFQTYVEALKKQGQWNEQTAEIAFAEARNKAIAVMGEKAKEALSAAFGDAVLWIDNKIEMYVQLNKTCQL